MTDWNKALKYLPDGVCTMSKMPCRHVDGVYPKFLVRGKGAYVYDEAGTEYIDYPLGLGAVVLGHNHPVVTQAVREQLELGTIFGLPSPLECELAETICALVVPHAEQVRFVKTGSEATSAAVRIARAYTGRETIFCCGYHGWHDWYAGSTQHSAGVPEAVKQLIHKFPFNDQKALRDLITAQGVPAAIIMEPYVFDEPQSRFFTVLRRLCDTHGIVLIFDEVVTGFRTPGWTAQAKYNIRADLTCLGKAMSNGIASISCVCGSKELMDVLTKDTFVSSTFGGELTGIAAALATIKIIDREGVSQHIQALGERMIAEFRRINRSIEGCYIKGLPCRTWFDFPSEAHKSLFWQTCLENGVFLGYAQFLSLAHTHAEIDKTMNAFWQGMHMVRKYYEDPLAGLKGKPAQATFRVAVHDRSVDDAA